MSPETYLRRLGLRLTPDGEVDNSEALEAIRRFRAAVEAVQEAWDAVPEGIREEYAVTLTFGAGDDAARRYVDTIERHIPGNDEADVPADASWLEGGALL